MHAWSRNITIIFIALLLDTYLMEFHYCSNNMFVSVILMSVLGNTIVFIFIPYCNFSALYRDISVCLLETFQEVCMYCIFCLCPFSLLNGQSSMLIAQDQKKEETLNKLWLQTESEPMQNTLVLFYLFHLLHPF